MGLLQAAYRTYQALEKVPNLTGQGKEPLTPISHFIQNAQIEISITDEGEFQNARAVEKTDNKTIIPVTTDSANRVGDNDKAHPLSDQLRYLAPFGKRKHKAYCAQLQQWASSEYTHPKVRAVWAYIQKGTILQDLATVGTIELQENGQPTSGKIESSSYEKCLVRWRVLPAPEGGSECCWGDASLFESYSLYYKKQNENAKKDFCYITGEKDFACTMHPKGVVSSNYGAKLLSGNDSSGFTFRGRFSCATQAASVGYTSSQKAHHALRWVVSNHGTIIGGRTFLCWNPEGKKVPFLDFMHVSKEASHDFPSYSRELRTTLEGYENNLTPEDDVVIVALDAATTGRLSATYFHELKSSVFLRHMEHWYSTCVWESPHWGVQSPTLIRIASCAFGTEQNRRIEVDERILREHTQQLLHCLLEKRPLPKTMVAALAARASTPLAYKESREYLLFTACAVIRKYRNDCLKKEEWKLALDVTNEDRSYLFGRLLAIAECVERSAYDREESREPNAIRLQSVFSQRPLYTWRILHEQLTPYFARLAPSLRAYYRKTIEEIKDLIPPTGDPMLGKKLEDSYLLGYYHQRSAVSKKQPHKTEENEHEHTEK